MRSWSHNYEIFSHENKIRGLFFKILSIRAQKPMKHRVLEVIKISLVDLVGLNSLVNYYYHYSDSFYHYFREKLAFTLWGFANLTQHIKFLVRRLNYLHIKSYVTWIMVLAGICLRLCHSSDSQKDVSISAVFNAEHVKND